MCKQLYYSEILYFPAGTFFFLSIIMGCSAHIADYVIKLFE